MGIIIGVSTQKARVLNDKIKRGLIEIRKILLINPVKEAHK